MAKARGTLRSNMLGSGISYGRFGSQALHIAQDAYENNFSSRRGTGPWETRDGVVDGFYFYDNNPWPDAGRREKHFEDLEAHMLERGCRVVGRGSYPLAEDGDRRAAGEEGYTLAAIFVSASPDKVTEDVDAACACMHDLLKRYHETLGRPFKLHVVPSQETVWS